MVCDAAEKLDKKTLLQVESAEAQSTQSWLQERAGSGSGSESASNQDRWFGLTSRDLLVSPGKVRVGERLTESSLCDRPSSIYQSQRRTRIKQQACVLLNVGPLDWKSRARTCLVDAERVDQMKVQLCTRRKVWCSGPKQKVKSYGVYITPRSASPTQRLRVLHAT